MMLKLKPKLIIPCNLTTFFNDQTNYSPSYSFHLALKPTRRRFPKSIVISCNSSRSNGPSNNPDDRDHEFLEASLLLSETITHYRMRKYGFHEPRRWGSSSGRLSVSSGGQEPRPDLDLIWRSVFQRFQSPTIFLKISCDGDFLLPITVGDFAIERLIDSSYREEKERCPDNYQFVRNMVEKLGCEVKVVRITKRVVNTYYSRLFFSQPGVTDIRSVDVRPSDAINVAIRCKTNFLMKGPVFVSDNYHRLLCTPGKILERGQMTNSEKDLFWTAPIYVSKQIVLTDAIKIGYGMGRLRESKVTYDVLLDSASDGPDLLAQELDLMKNMSLAVREERYSDAAIWRDKLLKLRNSSQKH